MVGIEDGARGVEIEVVLRQPAPGQVGQHVEVVARHRVLGRTGLQEREFLHLVLDALARLVGQLEVLDALAEALHLDGLVVLRDPELLLDGFQLFAQEELPLRLGDLVLHRLADLGLQAGHLALGVEQRERALHAPEQRDRLQHLLELRGRRAGERCRKVGQCVRLVRAEAVEEGAQLLLVQGVEGQQLLDGVDDRERVGLHLGRVFRRGLRVRDLDEIGRFPAQPALDTEAAQAFGDELDPAVVADRLVDPHGRADGGEVLGRGRFAGCVGEHDTADAVRRGADALDRVVPVLGVDHDRQVLGREEGSALQRQQVDAVRQGLV